jgi:uncharacterized membrane protein YqjE
MDDAPHGLAGLGQSFAQFKDAIIGIAEDRIALVKLEAQEEKYRVIQIFIWISAAIVTGMLAITFASLTLLYIFRERAPFAVLAGLAVAYAISVVVIVVGFKKLVAKHPRPFAELPKQDEDNGTP